VTTMEELPRALAIRNARVVPITGDVIEKGTVVISEGVIEKIFDSSKEIPKGYHELDASGKWILPGFIDAHTHVGIHEEANGRAGNDTNEMTDPNTAHVRAIDAVNPSASHFERRSKEGC
jgi:imidazolonepropionase-like amidohydrolase